MFDGFADWLGNITWPLVSRALAAMGMGTITYTGADAALQGAIDASKAAAGALTGPTLDIIARTGFFDAMSITSGGLISGLSWLVLKRWALNAGGTS